MKTAGRTSRSIDFPAKPYRRWPCNEPVNLCDPCAEVLRSMGMGLDDARPEWLRRLKGRDETGAVIHTS